MLKDKAVSIRTCSPDIKAAPRYVLQLWEVGFWHEDFVDSEMGSLLRSGALVEVAEKEEIRVNPLSVAEGKKLRLILDLSNLNTVVVKSSVKFEDVAKVAPLLPPGGFMASFDLKVEEKSESGGNWGCRERSSGYGISVQVATHVRGEKRNQRLVEFDYRFEGIPIAAIPDLSNALKIFSDASEFGVGAVLHLNLEEKVSASANLPPELIEISNTVRELYAILFGLRAFRKHLVDEEAIWHCDNQAAVAILRKGTTKSQLQKVAEDIWTICARLHLTVKFCWIAREFNTKADLASRAIDFDEWSVRAEKRAVATAVGEACAEAVAVNAFSEKAVIWWKKEFAWPLPSKDEDILRALLRGAKRTTPPPRHRKKATQKDVDTVIAWALQKKSFSGVAGAAMILLLFAAFLRVGELCEICVSDISRKGNDVWWLIIRRSKTDQGAQGAKVAFRLGGEALILWSIRELTSTKSGTIHFWQNFQSALEGCRRSPYQRNPRSSQPARKFTTHSFRGGAATTAIRSGLHPANIMRAGRWRSTEAFSCYIDPSPL
ncbi:unnamed protein product [Cylicocyclus nassatus]|uniref:Tyr recombinase domain-containing protein n=1 Tax=Cylicocyclus nassatus TaxID=53992 RepID=A0AA36GMU6_CYLNA|nr:unnamed protein product [Cylicocyclus nassatus]